jgi:hypothetical protein
MTHPQRAQEIGDDATPGRTGPTLTDKVGKVGLQVRAVLVAKGAGIETKKPAEENARPPLSAPHGSGAFRHETARTDEIDETREPFRFGDERLPASRPEREQPPAVIGSRKLLHESRFFHPLERPVDRAGAHAQARSRRRFNGLHDRVAVSRPLGKREEDVKDGRRERPLSRVSHPSTFAISATEVYFRYGNSQGVSAGSPQARDHATKGK